MVVNVRHFLQLQHTVGLTLSNWTRIQHLNPVQVFVEPFNAPGRISVRRAIQASHVAHGILVTCQCQRHQTWRLFIYFFFYWVSLLRWRSALWKEETGLYPKETHKDLQVANRPSNVGPRDFNSIYIFIRVTLCPQLLTNRCSAYYVWNFLTVFQMTKASPPTSLHLPFFILQTERPMAQFLSTLAKCNDALTNAVAVRSGPSHAGFLSGRT